MSYRTACCFVLLIACGGQSEPVAEVGGLTDQETAEDSFSAKAGRGGKMKAKRRLASQSAPPEQRRADMNKRIDRASDDVREVQKRQEALYFYLLDRKTAETTDCDPPHIDQYRKSPKPYCPYPDGVALESPRQ